MNYFYKFFLCLWLIGFLTANLSMNKFRSNCKNPLEQAALASSISIAVKQLAVVQKGCQQYLNSKEDKEFWQENMEQMEKNLRSLDAQATTQEKYLVLKQFRETIKQVPNNIF